MYCFSSAGLIAQQNNLQSGIFNISFNNSETSFSQEIPVLNNNVQISQDGVNGSSGYFNGNSFLSLRDQPYLRSNKGTVSAWIKTTEGGTIFSLGNNSTNNYFFVLKIINNSIQFYYFANNFTPVLRGTAWISNNMNINLQDNAWHQFTWESDGSQWIGYIDGQKVPLVQERANNDGKWFGSFNLTTNTISIGGLNRPLKDYFKGEIDELVIYNKVLTSNEINQMYITKNQLTSNVSAQNLDPLIRFSFDSNFNYILRIKNQIINHGVQIQSIDSRSAGYFNGDSYLELLDLNYLRSSGGSISAWIKTTTGGVIFSLSNKNNDSNYLLLSISNNSIIFYYWNNTNQYETIFGGSLPGTSLTDNKWHQLIWESNGTEWTGYIDGKQVSLIPQSVSGVYNRGTNDGTWFNDFNSTTNTFSIGVLDRPSMYGYYNGYIDNIEIFNENYSSSQINSYQLGNNVTGNNPVNTFLNNNWISLTLLIIIIIAIPILTYLHRSNAKMQNNQLRKKNQDLVSRYNESNNSRMISTNFCINCNARISSEDQFCSNCGTLIIKL